MVKINRQGCTRIVILTKNYAFKIPNFLDGYKLFLTGLLANLQEKQFAILKYKKLCPILFTLPLGFLIVMPRVDMLSEQEFLNINFEDFDMYKSEIFPYKLDIIENGYFISVENKANSFGWYKNDLVCVDYGN